MLSGYMKRAGNKEERIENVYRHENEKVTASKVCVACVDIENEFE